MIDPKVAFIAGIVVECTAVVAACGAIVHNDCKVTNTIIQKLTAERDAVLKAATILARDDLKETED